MTLEQSAHAEDHDHSEQVYTCPMHPEVKSGKPGKCPICHMDLVLVKGAKAAENKNTEKKIKFYRNPMNPAITSKAPMKDEMGMDYIPVYEDEGKKDDSTASGRSSFDLSEPQVKAVQLKTVKVEKRALAEELRVAARVLYGSSIAMQVLEADSSKVKIGQIFTFKSLGAVSEFKGKIAGVDNALDPMTRTVRVTGTLSNAQGLRAESSGLATIQINRGTGLYIPESSLMRTGTEDIVYLVSSSGLTPKKVNVGVKVDSGFEIVSGLNEGDEISSGPNFLLDSEARIRGAHD